MKVLVLGGTRFVGLRLVRLLVSQGHEVTLLNRGRTQAQLPSGIKRLYADRRDEKAMRSSLAGADFEAVFDMTAYQVPNLMPIIELFGGRIRHYVFCSTAGVYAPSEVAPVAEDSPYGPKEGSAPGLSSYTSDKIKCEEFLIQTWRERGFPATILRPTAIYGPENWMDDREGSFFFRLLKGRKILVPGNGATLLHLGHVDDVARAHLAVVGQKKALGQAYNITGPQAITINGFIDTIAAIVGVKAQKVYVEPAGLKGLKTPIFPFAWDQNRVFSVQKAKDDFGFWPEYDFKSGMEDTYRWWRQERGPEKIELVPGKLGHDVDLTMEDELLQRYG